MDSEDIDSLINYGNEFMGTYYLLCSYVNKEMPEMSEERFLTNTSEFEWESISDHVFEIADSTVFELNASVLKTNRDSQEYFYLGKVEKFFKSIVDLDDAFQYLHLEEMKKSFHTPKGKEIVELVQEVGDKLDDIRTFIAQHFENSKILFENAVKFPVLSSLVQYSINSDRTDYSGFLPENIVWPTIAKESTEPGVKLQWKGDKTDLAELIWSLYKSERITDTTTGKPVTQKELVSQLITLLGLDTLDVANLMKYKYGTKSKTTSYKAKDGKTFPAELQQLLSGRILD